MESTQKEKPVTDSIQFKSGYSNVNGIQLYYESYGAGKPLILLHGGGSTIQSTFGRIIPLLSQSYNVIALELQNHGRSGMRTDKETFEQDADDVAAFMENMKIEKANLLGFSNGGTTALLVAIRHQEKVNKLIAIAAATKRSGFFPGFFDVMNKATLENMPAELKTAFLEVNDSREGLQNMFEKDRDRMIAFADIDDQLLRMITNPTLIINGDADVMVSKHALEIASLIPGCRLAILPGTHGDCIGEITTLNKGLKETEISVKLIQQFLETPVLQ